MGRITLTEVWILNYDPTVCNHYSRGFLWDWIHVECAERVWPQTRGDGLTLSKDCKVSYVHIWLMGLEVFAIYWPWNLSHP